MRIFLFAVVMVFLFIVMNVAAGIVTMELRTPGEGPDTVLMWTVLGITYVIYFVILILAARKYLHKRS